MKPLQFNWRGFFRLIESVETQHTILYLSLEKTTHKRIAGNEQ